MKTAQIEESKRGLIRAFPLLLRSNANINSQLGAIGFYGLPSNYLSQYQQYISAVSAEDVQQAWQKHIHPEKFLTVLAGKDISTNEVAELYEKLLAPYQQLAPSQKTDDAEKNALEVKNNSDQAPLTTTP